MRIKSKLALVLALAGGLLLCFVLLDRQQLDKRTMEFQQDLAAEKAQAFETVFSLIRAPYHGYVVDMTFWDEFVDFVSVQEEEWAATNIDSSAETFDIDFILVFNLQHELVYAYADEESPILTHQVTDIMDWEAAFPKDARFCNYHLQLGAKLFEIDGATIHPTDDPDRKTAPRGYLIIGKQYGKDFLMDIADATGSEIELNTRGAQTSAEQEILIEGNTVCITRPLMNASGKPLATLMAKYDDASLSSFAGFIRRHFFTMAGFFGVMGLIVVSLASYWIQKPLTNIGAALANEDVPSLKKHGKTHGDFEDICEVLVDGLEHHLAVEHEVDERIAAEKKLSEARDEAERANRAKSEFLANMSHEIRTPMNAVLGFTELSMDKATDPEAREYLGRIEYGGKMMLSLIDDILDMSKIEAGKMTVEEAPTDVCEVLHGIIAVLQLEAGKKGLELTHDCPADIPPPVQIDSAKLRQIIFNLLTNAIKFTDRGSVDVRLNWESLSDTHCRLEISVKDTGIGIEPAEQERIFEAFIQQAGQDQVRYGGTGLGLTLSQKIARLMGGEIALQSTPGEGSCFTVSWPEVPFVKPGTELLAMKPDDSPPVDLTGRRILVAEDDATNRLLLQSALNKAGATVVFAHNGEDALQRILHEPFDLVFSDLQMPKLNGMELLERVKGNPDTAGLPFILMTATVTAEDAEKARALGSYELMSKPISLKQLGRIAASAMDGSDDDS